MTNLLPGMTGYRRPIIDPYDGRQIRPHPAKFSDSLLPVIGSMIPYGTEWIFDPMAGVGKITNLGSKFKYHCNELEPEWADQIKNADVVTTGDAKNCIFPSGSVVITSPPYGNRMADCFVTQRKGSMKGRYAGDLGRRLTNGSTASIKFNSKYREMMVDIYSSVFNQMNRGGVFILNVSNFIAGGVEQNVIGFYLQLFTRSGFTLDTFETVITPRSKGHGANSNVRCDHEVVMKWRKL